MSCVILLDVDGVLADFMGEVIRWANYFAQAEKYTRTSFPNYEVFDQLTPREKQYVFSQITEEGFCGSIPVIHGAHDGVELLRNYGEVYFVISPWWSSRHWIHERTKWLEHHFKVKNSHMVHTSAKHLVRGDLLVDDRVETVVHWQRRHPDGRGVIWTTEHNKLDEAPGIYRTNNWLDLVDLIR